MDKFWNFIKNEETSETELYFEGPISSSTWYGAEQTSGQSYRLDLKSGWRCVRRKSDLYYAEKS